MGLAEDFRVNDEVFQQSKELYKCLKLILKEADRLLGLVSMQASSKSLGLKC